MSSPQITALVLSLRRRAEADAQEQLRRLGAQLELCRRSVVGAQHELEQALKDQARLYRHGQQGPEAASTASPQRARELVSQSERLLRQRQLVREKQQAVLLQTAQLQALQQREGELRAALRLALGRREAAELHQALERRDQRRTRAQRQRAIEEEARDRFLSAQKQGKGQRRTRD